MILKILKFFLNSKPVTEKEIDNSVINNILIVRQHNQLGDMLCSLSLFAAIRKKFPKAKITLIASPINYEILFSEINPYIDDVLVYNKSTFLHLLNFFKKLRSKKFDIGIVPSTVSVSRTSHFINYLSGAKIRVGVKQINDKFNKVEFLLNIKSVFHWDKRKLHQIDRNLEIGKQIGCKLSQEEKNKVVIKLSNDELSFAENYINTNFTDKFKKIIAFHPGAGKIPNRWSDEKFIELIYRLHEKYNCYVLLTSGLIDKEITDKIKKELNEKKINCTVLENTAIRKVGAVLTKADLYITNDTGTMHVAAMVNAKVIGLFGPTNAYEWGPQNEFGTYIQSRTNNIDDITVDEVLNKASQILDK